MSNEIQCHIMSREMNSTEPFQSVRNTELGNSSDLNKGTEDVQHEDVSMDIKDEESVDAAMLLTSMKSMVSREIQFGHEHSQMVPKDSGWMSLSLPNLERPNDRAAIVGDTQGKRSIISPRFSGHRSVFTADTTPGAGAWCNRVRSVSHDEDTCEGDGLQEGQEQYSVPSQFVSGTSRKRAVSIDHQIKEKRQDNWSYLSPPNSPRAVLNSAVSFQDLTVPMTPPSKKEAVTSAAVVTPVEYGSAKGRRLTSQMNSSCGRKLSPSSVKTILRRKFSWKNYPELEAFLIANREEYLRHSALNYTVQQKQYNNRLTKRLLELAAEHGYVFDEEAFNFVTVRDRIRCYFKSYVQSSKKRGVIIGYAARRAGLLSEEDLERSVGKSGKIIVPT